MKIEKIKKLHQFRLNKIASRVNHIIIVLKCHSRIGFGIF